MYIYMYICIYILYMYISVIYTYMVHKKSKSTKHLHTICGHVFKRVFSIHFLVPKYVLMQRNLPSKVHRNE